MPKITLYYAPISALPVGEISADEQIEAEQFTNADRRAAFLRVRSAVRAILAAELGRPAATLAIRRHPDGKPAVDGREFSLSHSGDHLVVATAGEPVGVDLESRVPQRDVLTIADRFFSREDALWLRAQPPERRSAEFLRQWVAKEAALKVRGWGLAGRLEHARHHFTAGPSSCVSCGGEVFGIAEFAVAPGIPGAVAWAGTASATIVRRAVPSLC